MGSEMCIRDRLQGFVGEAREASTTLVQGIDSPGSNAPTLGHDRQIVTPERTRAGQSFHRREQFLRVLYLDIPARRKAAA